MVLQIILDVVRRRWKTIALAVFQLSIMFKVIWQSWPGVDVWAGPLAGVWFLAIPPGQMLQGREFYQLPASRREWWLARWWLSTAGAALVATLAVVAADLQAGRPRQTPERLALFALFAFLFGGCVMVLAATGVGRQVDQPVDRQPKLSPPGTFKNDPALNVRWLAFKIFLRVIGGMLGLTLVVLAAPFVFARFLPHTFGEISVRSAIVIAAMLGASAFGLLHHPVIAPRPAMRRTARPDAAARAVSKQTFVDQLTGWHLALWNECRTQLTTFAAFLALVLMAWAVSSLFRHVPPLPEFLSNADALPLASHRAHVTEFATWGFLYFFVGLFDAATPPRVRALRTLPLSTNKLSGLPAALGLVSATMLWAVLVALHVLVLQTAPVAPRIDLFLAFAGLVALSHAMRFVSPGQSMTKGLIGFAPFAAVMLAGGYFIDAWHPEIVQPVMLAGGLVSIVLSFFLMRVSLGRNSRMYRPPAIVARFQ